MLENALGSSPSGRYSAGGVSLNTMNRVTPSVVATQIQARLREAVSQSPTPSKRVARRFSFGSAASETPRPRRAAAVGITPMATNIDARIEADKAIAISEYNWPASSSTNRTGTNTSTVVSVDARTAAQTSRVPCSAAAKRSSPRLRACSIDSRTTIVLSTVMPTAKATPASEITLMVRPNASKPRNAAMVQIGKPMAAISVARAERRNSSMTRVANRAPMPRLVQTFRIEACT
jgi:hypothetical protein